MIQFEGLEELLEQIRVRRELPAPSVRRELRERTGLTQGDVARLLKVSDGAVSRYENGKREPRGERRENYSTLLKQLDQADIK